MNLNSGSLMKAAGIGAGVGIVLGLLGLIPILGIVFACLGFFVPVGVGALYAFFTAQDGETLENGPAAAGGAVSALVAGLVAGVFNLVVGAVVGSATGAFSQFGDLGLGADEAAAVAGFAVVGGIIGLCVGIVIAAALGAIGAVIYVAIAGRQSA